MMIIEICPLFLLLRENSPTLPGKFSSSTSLNYPSDINECELHGQTLCEQLCVDIRGSYTCACVKPFMLNSDMRTCSCELSVIGLFVLLWNGGCLELAHVLNLEKLVIPSIGISYEYRVLEYHMMGIFLFL